MIAISSSVYPLLDIGQKTRKARKVTAIINLLNVTVLVHILINEHVFVVNVIITDLSDKQPVPPSSDMRTI